MRRADEIPHPDTVGTSYDENGLWDERVVRGPRPQPQPTIPSPFMG